MIGTLLVIGLIGAAAAAAAKEERQKKIRDCERRINRLESNISYDVNHFEVASNELGKSIEGSHLVNSSFDGSFNKRDFQRGYRYSNSLNIPSFNSSPSTQLLNSDVEASIQWYTLSTGRQVTFNQSGQVMDACFNQCINGEKDANAMLSQLRNELAMVRSDEFFKKKSLWQRIFG